jgi:hypothetical protein
MSFNLSNLYRNIFNDIFLHDSRLYLIDLITQKTIYKVCKFYLIKQILELNFNNEIIIEIGNKLQNATNSNLLELIIEIFQQYIQPNTNIQSNTNINYLITISISMLVNDSTKINQTFEKTNCLEIFKKEYPNSDNKNLLIINFIASLFIKTGIILIDEISKKVIIDDKLKIDDGTEENIYRLTKEIESICEQNDIFD